MLKTLLDGLWVQKDTTQKIICREVNRTFFSSVQLEHHSKREQEKEY